ncbi:unnamed protein product, partial [Mesorhabditis spiculigera]
MLRTRNLFIVCRFSSSGFRRQERHKEIDFREHPKRRIAISFYYYGWAHDGLQSQKNGATNAVADHLISALKRANLVEEPALALLRFSGRTDAGVSAMRQVASCIVRSGDPQGEGVFWPEGSSASSVEDYPHRYGELPYVKMLNRNLPPSIRVLSWAPADVDFHPTHALSRSYKYAMPRADLDIGKMRMAADSLIGEHDFRHFCKIDASRTDASYVRHVKSIDLQIQGDAADPYSLLVLSITANGFHYHMVRYMASVLQFVGRGSEEPEITSQLLDINKVRARPNYSITKSDPLLYMGPKYETKLDWRQDDDDLSRQLTRLQKDWVQLRMRSQVIENLIGEVKSSLPSEKKASCSGLLDGIQEGYRHQYKPIFQLEDCFTLDEKRRRYAEKKIKKSLTNAATRGE